MFLVYIEITAYQHKAVVHKGRAAAEADHGRGDGGEEDGRHDAQRDQVREKLVQTRF